MIQLKMGYRLKQRILNRRISNGKRTFKELLNILIHLGNANQNNSEIPSYTVRMAKIKSTDDSLCWRGCRVRGKLLHYWSEYKLVTL